MKSIFRSGLVERGNRTIRYENEVQEDQAESRERLLNILHDEKLISVSSMQRNTTVMKMVQKNQLRIGLFTTFLPSMKEMASMKLKVSLRE